MGQSLVIITDAERLGEALERAVCRGMGSSVDIIRITYAQCQNYLPRLSKEADYFVLDLLMNYAGGMRAEGVVLGERLIRQGKNVLIISCLSLGKQLSLPCYWDVTSENSLDSHLKQFVNQKMIDIDKDIEKLKNTFQNLLHLPPQHLCNLSL